ncbi:MAG: hypothetical protein R2685_13310 [Candidatus Nitrosocosmicus sp.]|nr:hypothetical protein [Candidatus Nitrosocosmicus sp.]
MFFYSLYCVLLTEHSNNLAARRLGNRSQVFITNQTSELFTGLASITSTITSTITITIYINNKKSST